MRGSEKGALMPSPAGDTGERPIPRRRRFVVWDWDELLPVLARMVVLVAVAYFAGNTQTGEVADALLRAEENAATTQEVRAVGATRLEEEYGTIHEMIRYHAVRDAECDSALEVYERHLGDPHEWAHVLEECHSETPVHPHPEEDPQ